MKKLLIILAIFLSTQNLSSQTRQVVVDKCINTSQVIGPPGIICSNELRTKWFTLIPSLQLDGNRLSMSGFIVIKNNIGITSEKDQLIFSFRDGTKLRLTKVKNYDSQNSAFFALTDLEFVILKSKSIKSVRYFNAVNVSSFYYASYNEVERYYFINLFNHYYIRNVYCK